MYKRQHHAARKTDVAAQADKHIGLQSTHHLQALPKRLQQTQGQQSRSDQPFAAQTVRENIAVGAHLHLPQRALALARAEEVALQVGLSSQLDKLASDLTVAGRKRLEMARALAARPKLLLLDEVLAGLNPQEIAEMIPVVRNLVAQGVTVLMIEHVMQAVMNLAEHVWVLAQGKLIAEGTPSQVTQNAQVIEAYLGHGTAARLRAQHGDKP